MDENQKFEKKSIRKIRGESADIIDLARICVCFANSQGGKIVIGIEDKENEPPSNQIIELNELNKLVDRLRNLTFNVGIYNPAIIKHQNGGQYIELFVHPSLKSIATTSEGRIFIRVGDNCQPIRSEDIVNLAQQKDSYQWELAGKTHINEISESKILGFIKQIRESEKVSNFIKNKTDLEILEHYCLSNNEQVTNLGVLWLGNAKQKSKLNYPLTVQYIVYDNYEEKIRKVTWHNIEADPHQLLKEIESQAIELKYSYEFPNGLYRKNVWQYPPEVIRELLVNAFAHKSYTISNDIFIEVFHDRLTITNPGGLPLGITKDNILHERYRRNPNFMNIFCDLNLMEGEGSGYDLIYEKLTYDGKEFPELYSDYNKFSVTIYSKIIDEQIFNLLDYLEKYFQLTQKEIIVLGIIARHKRILSPQLSKLLQLQQEDRLRSWVAKLCENKLLISRGHKKGTTYLINPELIAQSKINLSPSLKTVEGHRLIALIEEDIRTYPKSYVDDIFHRIKEIPKKEIQKFLYKLVKNGTLEHSGGTRYRHYSLVKKKIK